MSNPWGGPDRYVVVFSDAVQGDQAAAVEALRSVAGAVDIASTRDFASAAVDPGQARTADATIFAHLGVAVVSVDPAGAGQFAAAVARDSRIVAAEPERVYHATTNSTLQPAAVGPDSDEATWGLLATEALGARGDGRGVAVAVLDTGLDLGHPDFAGRAVRTASFVPGASPQDGHGHGTHCAGVACGTRTPDGRRYGVAPAADLLVGKVLTDRGTGTDSTILAGLDWALAHRCQVVSMSLGADVRDVSTVYHVVGRRALTAGTLIVAAAGNSASRSFGEPGFVGAPANSPSIMAVAAVDPALRVAEFSGRSHLMVGGKVDIAAPGVDVFSAWRMPARYHTLSGTSMAAPHVAGIAALWSQVTGATGTTLWSTLRRAARRLHLPLNDVGAGLVQAPR